MKSLLLSVLFVGVLLTDAWENILYGHTDRTYGSILTDGQRETSCIATGLNIGFNLEKNYSIKSVSIFFKESNGSQIKLTTADFVSWRMYHMLDETPAEVTFRGQRESNFIDIVIDPVNLLNVCEIEALGCEKGFHGENCTKCELPANCETCDITNGSCYRCHSNSTGPDCLQENNNLLLGGQYLYLANYSYDMTGGYPLDPLLMTDGIVEKSMCQNVEGFPKRLLFRILDDVKHSLNVKMINVYLSFIDIQEDQNITLHISAEKGKFGFFNSSTTFNLSPEEVYRFPFAVHTNTIYMEITISYPNTTLSGSLLVCEIEAIGCPGRYYGTPCRPCDISGCATSECHPLDGSCVCGSVLNDGTSCRERALCKIGLFGKYCNQSCSSHCKSSCHQGNGTCIGGCADGWTSDRCDQENILFGRSNSRYSSVLTDGQRKTSCIVGYDNPAGVQIWFNLYNYYSFNTVSIFFGGEINDTTIMLRTADFTSWRMYHILDQTPTEVTFLGQRESDIIDITIYPKNQIYVCEIEVAGCEKGFYGENCTKCDLPANCETCDVKDGSCYRCHRNFTGPDCLQENNNLLLGGQYLRLANYSYDMTGGYPLDPLLMTDGIVEKSMCQNLEGFPKRLLFRILDDANLFLNVKMINVHLALKNIQDDENIEIHIYAEEGKFGYYNSSTSFNLSSDEVYRIPFAFNTNSILMEITITYSNTTLPGSLLVCEIEAIGCISGYYGTPCRPCDISGCATGECHPLDGSCVCGLVLDDGTSCSEGELCTFGWFGKYCDQRCSNHCNVSNDCYQGNGTCKGGCADGWTSDRCDQGGYMYQYTDEKKVTGPVFLWLQIYLRQSVSSS